VTDICDRLFRNASRIKPIPLTGIVRDAGDDHVLALAIASGASLIVTGDKDLLSLGSYRGIDIVTPSKFIELVTRGLQR
jgi:predicted nucleic acid-binding protein